MFKKAIIPYILGVLFLTETAIAYQEANVLILETVAKDLGALAPNWQKNHVANSETSVTSINYIKDVRVFNQNGDFLFHIKQTAARHAIKKGYLELINYDREKKENGIVPVKRIALSDKLPAIQPEDKTVAKQNVPASQQQAIVDKQKALAKDRMYQDLKIYSKLELQEIESLYQVANKKGLSSKEAENSLKEMISKFKKANRTGCALLYLGQMSKGDEQIKYLQLAIDEFSDCFYGDGVQVGAYARFKLLECYTQSGENVESQKLIEDLKNNYPDAIDHGGQNLVTMLKQEPARSSSPTTRSTPSTPDHKEIRIDEILETKTPASDSLPPPERKEMRIDDLLARLSDLDGKIIKTSVNSVYNLKQVYENRYSARCGCDTGNGGGFSYETILIPQEGKEFFQSLAKQGYGGSFQTVYLRIHSKSPIQIRTGSSLYSFPLEAVGARYSSSKNQYIW